jgi:hypothetical protein
VGRIKINKNAGANFFYPRVKFGLSILGGVFGLFSFQSFFFVGEVSVVLFPLSVVLLLASKTAVVVLCYRKVVVDVT